MAKESIPLDVKSAEDHLMRLLAVDGVTGEEAAVAAAVADDLKRAGVPASAIRFDTVNKRIPLPTQMLWFAGWCVAVSFLLAFAAHEVRRREARTALSTG